MIAALAHPIVRSRALIRARGRAARKTAPPAPLLLDWDARKTEQFKSADAPMRFRHDLESTGLFGDAALIALLDAHPSHLLDVCTMGAPDHPVFPNKFRTGDFRKTDPESLLRAAKDGRIWINVREAMNVHAQYRDVLDRLYGELARETGNAAVNAKGGVLISSSITKVPYHVDKTEVVLWHVRGRKRIYVYPTGPDFIPDPSYEATLTDIINDDLPYHPSMEAAAQTFDLKPGEAVTWPLNSPHRVDNRSFCVSVTTEYSTRESALKNSAMLANAMLRSRFGRDPSYAADGPATRRIKSVAGRMLDRAGLVPRTAGTDWVTFEVLPDGTLRDVEPFVRDF